LNLGTWDVEGLHKLIGTIIAKRPKLSGKELQFLRKEMEMSQRAPLFTTPSDPF